MGKEQFDGDRTAGESILGTGTWEELYGSRRGGGARSYSIQQQITFVGDCDQVCATIGNNAIEEGGEAGNEGEDEDEGPKVESLECTAGEERAGDVSQDTV